MHRRASAILAAILVAGLTVTATATAIDDYTLSLCDEPENDCHGLTVTSDQHPGAGQPFSLVVDLDVYNGAARDICAVWIAIPIEENRVEFLDVDRYQMDPSHAATCYSSHPSDSSTAECPECDATLLCHVGSPWGLAAGRMITEESAELKLDFLMLDPDPIQSSTGPPTGRPVAFDGNYSVMEWEGGNCGEYVHSAPIESTVVVVPEPGELAMLAAGLPLLAIISRRRNRRAG